MLEKTEGRRRRRQRMRWLDRITDSVDINFSKLQRLPRWLSCKESACQRRRLGLDPWVRKILLRKKWQPIPVFLPGKWHGQRSLVGYSAHVHRVRHDWDIEHTQLWEYKFQFFDATSLRQFVMAALRKPPSTSIFLFGALIFFKAVTVLSASLKEVIKNFWWLTSQLTTTKRQKLGEHLKRNVKDTWKLGYRKMTLPFKMWLTGWI